MSTTKNIVSQGTLTIDMDARTVTHTCDGSKEDMSLDGPEAFELISRAWLRSGWASKYSYGFTWMGRPIIQIPEDVVRIQEIVYQVKPDVVVETGIAHGGSLIFYAALCKMMDKGRVVGVDIEIRSHNRKAIEAHELFPYITLIEASSTEQSTIDQVRQHIKANETVLIVLDSCHTKAHVLEELQMYAPLCTVGSYMLVADGIMAAVVGAPGTGADWVTNNPIEAVKEFVSKNPNFKIEEPEFPFNEGMVKQRLTYFPSGVVKRIS